MYRILIVEDDQRIAELLSNHLDKYGYQPIVTQQFDAIDQAFEQIMPHLVLLDVNLPKLMDTIGANKYEKFHLVP